MATQTAPAAPSPAAERVPPYNEEAERAVLGSALLDAARVIDLCVENGIVTESFHVHAHRVIFETLLDLAHDNKPIDLLTVADRLRDRGQLDHVGGTTYLDHLVDATPTAAHAEYYTDIVLQKHLLRRMIESARETIDHCYRSEEQAQVLLGNAEQSFFSISESQRTAFRPWPDLVNQAMDDIEMIYQSKKGETGLPTGFVDLDRILLGLHRSDMIVVAARPSMGKTSLALNIAEHVATSENPKPVAIFSLEMSAEQLVRRMLCCRARVPSHKLRGGYIGDVSHSDLTQAAAVLRKAPIYLDDTAGLTALELRSRARRMRRRFGIELIIVDYLQMMDFPQYAKEGRQRETAAISGAMKAMAKELRIPVLVLSQLSRAPETRDRRAIPRLSDLRDSGSIEQDADVVCLLRRPCVYPEDPDHDDETLAIVDVAKHRNGQTGETKLLFLKEFTRFENRRPQGVDGESKEAELPPSSGGLEG